VTTSSQRTRTSPPWSATRTTASWSSTPAYMPPEQARGERELMSPASDVWALGAVLYALLFGRAPYRGEAAGHPAEGAGAAHPRVPTRVPAPAALVEICLRCMRLDPRQRYADGAAVAAELTAWLEGARSRERALTLTDQARAVLPLIEAAEVRAAQARERARAAVVGLRPGDTLEVKEAAWGLEEEAQRQSDEVQGPLCRGGDPGAQRAGAGPRAARGPRLARRPLAAPRRGRRAAG
jgi:hypothetical protein